MKPVFYIFIYLSLLFVWNTSYAGYIFKEWSVNDDSVCKLELEENMTESPGWNGIGKPPITVEDSNKIVENWSKSKFGQDIDLHIVSYQLNSFRTKEMKNNVWLWNLELRKFNNGTPMNEFIDNVIILMDGKLIEKVCN